MFYFYIRNLKIKEEIMKKIISAVLSTVLFVTTFLSLTANAASLEKVYSYTSFDGQIIEYYKDAYGEDYVVENGKRIYIAVPTSTWEIVDDEDIIALEDWKQEIDCSPKAVQPYANKKAIIAYTGNMDFSSTIATSSVIGTQGYIYCYLKCSSLRPIGAKRGFSYQIRFSPDGSTWYLNRYVNQSLSSYTRHRMSELGNAQYIQIKIWSYYGTVKTCTLSVKLADS
jgi:hypothetical protein